MAGGRWRLNEQWLCCEKKWYCEKEWSDISWKKTPLRSCTGEHGQAREGNLPSPYVVPTTVISLLTTFGLFWTKPEAKVSSEVMATTVAKRRKMVRFIVTVSHNFGCGLGLWWLVKRLWISNRCFVVLLLGLSIARTSQRGIGTCELVSCQISIFSWWRGWKTKFVGVGHRWVNHLLGAWRVPSEWKNTLVTVHFKKRKGTAGAATLTMTLIF